MLYFVLDCFWLALGLVCFILGTITVIKIYKGSKITFAYSMAFFTCAYGVVFLVRSVDLFLSQWKTKTSVYVDLFFAWTYYWLSL